MGEQFNGCSVVISIDKAEIQRDDMEQLFQVFLRDVKIPFEIIEFADSTTTSLPRSESLEKIETSSRNPQSLAVCLFLKEPPDNKTSQHQLARQFLKSPWQLNHVIESPQHAKPRKIARQEFYSFSNDFPLWSVNTVHYGNEHVRLHINARNFPAMTEFYEILTDREARYCGHDFCFLTIYSEDELDVQIGLKSCPKGLTPMPSKTYKLKFRMEGESPLFKYLESLQGSNEETSYVLEDPDGNEVVVERFCIDEHEKSVTQVHENIDAECDVTDFNTNEKDCHKKCSGLCVDHGRCSCEIKNDKDCCKVDFYENYEDYITLV